MLARRRVHTAIRGYEREPQVLACHQIETSTVSKLGLNSILLCALGSTAAYPLMPAKCKEIVKKSHCCCAPFQMHRLLFCFFFDRCCVFASLATRATSHDSGKVFWAKGLFATCAFHPEAMSSFPMYGALIKTFRLSHPDRTNACVLGRPKSNLRRYVKNFNHAQCLRAQTSTNSFIDVWARKRGCTVFGGLIQCRYSNLSLQGLA